MDPDSFDDLLGLEDRFYDEGYQLGTADGIKAGRIEGRVFGLEKGFEKYAEMGRLHGRSQVWNSRLANLEQRDTGGKGPSMLAAASTSSAPIPRLPPNPRLEKHLRVLYALTEPASLSTENTEDSVSDFDDRLKRAQGKTKIIERLVGVEGPQESSAGASSKGQNIEDVDILKARH
ncbi:MAG: hypothetical protein M1818_005353 [Claussenomyces sp. TS43310]|nr:MAG: hypothetical protein M1818_005353 [Claussenomyces sp. TS43310]